MASATSPYVWMVRKWFHGESWRLYHIAWDTFSLLLYCGRVCHVTAKKRALCRMALYFPYIDTPNYPGNCHIYPIQPAEYGNEARRRNPVVVIESRHSCRRGSNTSSTRRTLSFLQGPEEIAGGQLVDEHTITNYDELIRPKWVSTGS